MNALLSKTSLRGIFVGATAVMAALWATPAGAGGAYSLSVSNGKAKVGEAGAITVTVTAGEGFKANTEYPHKIKKLAVEGDAALAATTVPGAASKKSISYSVGVTPKSKGTHRVTGQIRFSVCNDEACHIKKVPLNATITGE